MPRVINATAVAPFGFNICYKWKLLHAVYLRQMERRIARSHPPRTSIAYVRETLYEITCNRRTLLLMKFPSSRASACSRSKFAIFFCTPRVAVPRGEWAIPIEETATMRPAGNFRVARKRLTIPETSPLRPLSCDRSVAMGNCNCVETIRNIRAARSDADFSSETLLPLPKGIAR